MPDCGTQVGLVHRRLKRDHPEIAAALARGDGMKLPFQPTASRLKLGAPMRSDSRNTVDIQDPCFRRRKVTLEKARELCAHQGPVWSRYGQVRRWAPTLWLKRSITPLPSTR